MKPKPARRGLGRGLAALIPESDFDMLNSVARGEAAAIPVTAPDESEASIATAEPASITTGLPDPSAPRSFRVGERPPEADGINAPSADIRYISVDKIEANPFQPRQVFSEEELENLSSSIKEHGVLQPILVRPLPQGRFQLVAGERRWRAATRAGLTQVPALVRAVDDKSSLELAIIENVQRHDISAVESAQAYVRLAKEFGLTGEAIAQRVGKSRSSVTNTMRLLDLPEEAINALREGKITEGHGRALLTAPGEGARRALLRRAVRDGLSVRELERLARESGEAADVEATPEIRLPRAPSTDLTRLETTLQRALGARLKLKAKRRGGQIIIDFSSPEELSRLVKRMTKPVGNEPAGTAESDPTSN
ncbi:MAG: ParB/RepB/Spo0J family partition protein [Hyphomicrobiales bacterium]|nr:MAG: ParB/RepB/Spo0J family partition protein [Hyphomicrobiales bacterium]